MVRRDSPAEVAAFGWDWVKSCVERALTETESTKTLILSKRERRAMYARALAHHLSARLRLLPLCQDWLARSHTRLLRALAFRAEWDGAPSSERLDDALTFRFRGLRDLEAMEKLGSDFEEHLDGEMLAQCRQIMAGVEVRSSWAAPMLLAASLRFVHRQQTFPENLREGLEFDLWPGGSVDLDPLPEQTVPVFWDPDAESKATALGRATKHVNAVLAMIERTHRAEGAESVRLKLAHRNVEATYLYLSGRTWNGIVSYFQRLSGNNEPTQTAIVEGVDEVMTTLGIAKPVRRPGRPRSRPRRENLLFSRITN